MIHKLILLALAAFISLNSFGQTDTLYVYGPGGPEAAVEECAKVFSKKYRIPVKVTAGPEDKWIDNAKQNADVIFGGAEYMLSQFATKHKGFLDSTTTTELYKRAAGILVRKGNPQKIKGLKDLTQKGIKLLNIDGAGQLGMWEDLAGRQNLIAGIQKNIGGSFANTALGIEAWKADASFDAWITFASWHNRLKDLTTLVKIPAPQNVFRGTPVAVTTGSTHKKEAQKFIRFMQTPEGHAIFRKWGWE